MENPPFEDVSQIKYGDFQCHVSFLEFTYTRHYTIFYDKETHQFTSVGAHDLERF